MARELRYTKRYDTYLSPTEDKELIDYIDNNTYGNGKAEQLRNALRALFAEHQRHQHPAGTAVDITEETA